MMGRNIKQPELSKASWGQAMLIIPRNTAVWWADQRRICERKQQSGSLGGARRKDRVE